MTGPYYNTGQGKEDKEGQKEWPDRLEEGSEVELTGELIWQPGSNAVKLRLVWYTYKLHHTPVQHTTPNGRLSTYRAIFTRLGDKFFYLRLVCGPIG